MDPNTLLLGVLGVALGFLAVWICAVRYRAKAKSEADGIIELARKEASVDRRQQLAEAELEIKKQRQDLEQETLRLKAELSDRQKALEDLEVSTRQTSSEIEERKDKLSKQEAALEELETSLQQ
ncbi:MAG: Rnase Y domain-containing protein, partial [Verrucomicrobia bacterium]|nr:Rnase Y domain-containing protein [Verrucomicrobiota bacterium]